MLAIAQDRVAVADPLVREIDFRRVIRSRPRRDHDVLTGHADRFAVGRLHFQRMRVDERSFAGVDGTRLRFIEAVPGRDLRVDHLVRSRQTADKSGSTRR